jgi:predicted MPP superfamily phosphohydrolase
MDKIINELKKENELLKQKLEEIQTQLKKYTNGDNHKRYYEKNKKKVKELGKKYTEKLKIENPEKIKEYRRNYYLKRKERLKQEQNNISV